MERSDPTSTQREVRETQVQPTAGIWYCTNCGRRIQEMLEGSKPKVGPYVCVCGTPMEPGDENTTPDARLDNARAPGNPTGTPVR